MGRQNDRGIKSRKSSSGVKWLSIDYESPKGRIRRALHLEDTPANRRVARSILAEARARSAAGIVDEPKTKAIRFLEYAEKWLCLQDHLALATSEGYRKILNAHWIPALGNRPIDEINAQDVAATLASGSWVTAKTRNNVLSVIKRVFSAAMDDGLIEKDPTERIKFAKHTRPEPNPLTPAEVEMVLGALPDGWRSYFEVAFFTGLRTSELIALRWSDLDVNRRILRVERAKVMSEVKGTKTGNARYVELSHRALNALLEIPRISEYVMTAPQTGLPIRDDRSPRMAWTKALKGCGLAHRDAYQTRHTYATMNLMLGARPEWIARMLGHTNLFMLNAVYGRWMPSMDGGAQAAKLDELTPPARLRVA